MIHDDRSTPPGRLRPFSAGGDFALRLHVARLAHCAGGRAFAAVIRSSPSETNDTGDPEGRTRLADLQTTQKHPDAAPHWSVEDAGRGQCDRGIWASDVWRGHTDQICAAS